MVYYFLLNQTNVRKIEKINKKEKAYLAPTCSHLAPQPAQRWGPLAQPPTVVLLATTEGQGHAPARAAPRLAAATSPIRGRRAALAAP